MSTFFSPRTENLLSNTPFQELDAAEQRLSSAGWQVVSEYLKTRMTPEDLQVVSWCEQQAAAVAAAGREVAA